MRKLRRKERSMRFDKKNKRFYHADPVKKIQNA